MKIALIVAMDNNNLIGKKNDLPWKLSADLQYFRKVTMGKPLIMGRTTHESIGRALPGRKNIVISRQKNYQADGCTVVESIEQALHACDNADEVMVMGGASIYQQMLEHANKLYITEVNASIEDGDTWFPDWDPTQWTLLSQESFNSDDKNAYPYRFLVYEK